MGKGDVKTKRGKIIKGSYGNTRPRHKHKKRGESSNKKTEEQS